ncbi:heterokaryon incompatibility, partial [Clohesyomyces aquaticus]
MIYATLSYVWGAAQEAVIPILTAGKTLQDLPQSLPNNIEDTLTVTSKLGIRYLWIDRYCINQRDADEVAIQTSIMHQIYRDSVFTIIAACGEDPSYGLPGVGKQRKLDPAFLPFTVEDYTYQPVWWDAKKLISSSKWVTRGWTYQEQRFARRRIYFSDNGACFPCD